MSQNVAGVRSRPPRQCTRSRVYRGNHLQQQQVVYGAAPAWITCLWAEVDPGTHFRLLHDQRLGIQHQVDLSLRAPERKVEGPGLQRWSLERPRGPSTAPLICSRPYLKKASV